MKALEAEGSMAGMWLLEDDCQLVRESGQLCRGRERNDTKPAKDVAAANFPPGDHLLRRQSRSKDGSTDLSLLCPLLGGDATVC